MKSSRALLEELDHCCTIPIHDPLWGHIHFPDFFIPILESKPFVKLASIRQLGPSYLVYPGASHTRYNHSIGVFSVATRFFSAVIRQDTQGLFTKEGMWSFLCAALCHDLGHFPFTHSLKELPLRDHEALTGDIIVNDLGTILANAGLDPSFVAAIIDHERSHDHPELAWYRKFLSGVLDPDKLDYLPRDAYFCGLPYGAQDIGFIFDSMRFDPSHGLGVSQEGSRAIEHLLFSKYLLYKAVYWHPMVRVATGMIKKAVHMALATQYIKPHELYGLHDQGFHDRLTRDDAPPSKLVESVFLGRLYTPLASFPVAEYPELESKLMDLEQRTRVEEQIRGDLQGLIPVSFDDTDILIDVPERISFEVHMPVWTRDGVIDYPDSKTVFTKDVVGNFTHSLRYARLVVNADKLGELPKRSQKDLDALFCKLCC